MKKGETNLVQQRSDEEVERLVNENMKLVHFFRLKYQHVARDEDELFSACMDGLLYAARYHAEKTGVPFGTYAGMSIKWKLCRLDLAAKRLKRGGETAVHIPLDSKISATGGNEREIHELIPDSETPQPDEAAGKSDAIADMMPHLQKLPPSERMVIELRFGVNNYEPHTLEQVAAKNGLTRERCRQIEEKGLTRLRHLCEGIHFQWDHKKHAAKSGIKVSAHGFGRKTKSIYAQRIKWKKRIDKAR